MGMAGESRIRLDLCYGFHHPAPVLTEEDHRAPLHILSRHLGNSLSNDCHVIAGHPHRSLRACSHSQVHLQSGSLSDRGKRGSSDLQQSGRMC